VFINDQAKYLIDDIDSISSPSLDFSSVETKPIKEGFIAPPS